MLPVIQIKNTLPLHLKLHFTAGPQMNNSFFLARKATMNIPVHAKDTFEVTLANNRDMKFLIDLQLTSTDIDQDTRTLTIDESKLRSWKGGSNDPREAKTIHTGFESLNFQLIGKDGTLGKTQDGPDIEAQAGQVYKIIPKDKPYQLGYMTIGTEALPYGPPRLHRFTYDYNIILHTAMFGTVQEGKHQIISGNDHLSNYSPGILANDGSRILLQEGQVLIYDQATTGSGESTSIPDGSNFVLIDEDIIDADATFALLDDFFGEQGFAKPKTMQATASTIVNFYANRNHSGTKTTKGGQQWYNLADTDFKSFSLKAVETQGQAHIHIMSALAEGLTSDKKNPNPAEFRTTINVRKIYDSTSKTYVYPKVQLEIANQSGFNSEFNTINVNGKDYTFDSNTNQTPYIAPSMLGKIIATMKPSSKRMGTPDLLVRTSAMPEGTWVGTAPAMGMHHRMKHMTNALGKDVGHHFDQFVQKSAKVKGGISLSQAGQVRSVTQSLNKSVVHGFRHTNAGNQTHNIVDGGHFSKSFDAVHLYNNGGTPTLYAVSAGSGSNALAMPLGYTGEVLLGFGGWISSIGHAISHATHAVVSTVDHAAESLAKAARSTVEAVKKAAEKAMAEAKAMAHAVEKVLVASITDIENNVYHFVLKTAEDVAQIATKIYDTIKMAIVDVIDFFKFLLSAFEDIPKMFNVVKNAIDNQYQHTIGKAQNYVVGQIEGDINTILQPLGISLSKPSSTSGSHPSSNPTSSKGKEKLHWLLHLLFKEILEGKDSSGDKNIDGIIQSLEKDVADNILKFLNSEIKSLVAGKTDLPGNIDDFMTSFISKLKLKDNAESFVSKTLNDAKQTVSDNLSDIINVLDKNPFDESVAEELIPSFLKGDLLDNLLDMVGLKSILDDITPANIVSMLYAVPAGIIYAFKTTHSNEQSLALATTAASDDSISFADPMVIDIMCIINDITSAISASITVEKAATVGKAAGGEGPKMNPFVNAVIMTFNFLNGISKATIASKAADDGKGFKAAVNSIISLRIFAGLWFAAAALKGSKLPVAKIQCVLDVLMGILGVSYNVYATATSNQHEFGNIAGTVESASQILEAFGFDEEPDSRTAGVIVMDFLKAVGLIFRGVDLAES